MNKIVVSSNCQTGGISATLKILFPGQAIVPIPLPNKEDAAGIYKLKSELVDADVWFSSGLFDLVENANVNLVKVPSIYFDAFHPDITYAHDFVTKKNTNVHYNSAIAGWAYNNKIDPRDATKLFNGYTYSQLGYLDRWRSSLNEFKSISVEFGVAPRDFDEFFNKIKRTGCFMHSINHPNIYAISEFVKLIAKNLIAFDQAIVIPDGLTNDLWPVYPEIALNLGLEGGLRWRLGREIDGILNYLIFSYENYEAQNILPGQLVLNFNIDNFSKILLSQLEK